MNIKVEIVGNNPELCSYIPWAKSQWKNVSTGLTHRAVSDDIIVEFNKNSDYIGTIKIYSIPTFGNFLTHPRWGFIKEDTYTIDNDTYNYQYINHTGTDSRDIDVVGPTLAYPLIDSDDATKLIEIYKDGQIFIEKNPPENYGNIDWIGTTPSEGGQATTVLSWIGPPSRYFEERTKPEGLHLGSTIYSEGIIIGTLPLSGRYTEIENIPIPYYVLGAAKSRDSFGTDWLVCVCREYAIEYSGTTIVVYSSMAILMRIFNNTEASTLTEDLEDNSGWIRIYDDKFINNGVTLMVPVFFNNNGSEARTIQGNYECRINIDVDTKQGSITTVSNNLTGEKVFTGIPSYTNESGDPYVAQNAAYYGTYSSETASGGHVTEYSNKAIAVDWVVDKWVYATIKWLFTIDGKTGSSEYYERQPQGTGLYGSWIRWEHTFTGSTGNHNIECVLEIGDINILIGQHTLSYVNGGNYDGYTISWNLNDGPQPTNLVRASDNVTFYKTYWKLNTICYLDIRNTILIGYSKTIDSISNTYSSTAYTVDGVTTPAPDRNQISTSSYNDVVVYDGTHRLNPLYTDTGFDGRLIDLPVQYFPTISYPAVLINSASYTAPSVFEWVLTSNHPIGQACFDSKHNSIISYLYNRGSRTYINGIDYTHLDITLRQAEAVVYFPISPVG